MLDYFTKDKKRLEDELDNFQRLSAPLQADEFPRLEGIDIYGKTVPLNASVGGDHIIYVDFKKRFNLAARKQQAYDSGRPDLADKIEESRRRAGILISDVAGHSVTDHLPNAMLHQMFLLGSRYEMDQHGEITTRLFEHINSHMYEVCAENSFITALYGEISESGRFRFISAGAPYPVVFSKKFDQLQLIGAEHIQNYLPIGVAQSRYDVDPSPKSQLGPFKESYTINEINLLGEGDLLLLFTDGLSEHGEDTYYPTHFNSLLRKIKHHNAQDIVETVISDMEAFAPLDDDLSLVVAKRLP